LNHAGDLPTAQHRTCKEPPTSLLNDSKTSSPAARARREQAFEVATSPAVVGLAVRTSLFIGTLLNLINQGDALFGAQPLALGKLLLTYLVPYCVATYSATSISLRGVASRP
jgi:hypothetical protein